MSIPCKMRPAGLDSLPMGYTRLEFLESDGLAMMTLPFESKNKSFACEHVAGMPTRTSGLYVYGGTAVSAGYGWRYYADTQSLSFSHQNKRYHGFKRGSKHKITWLCKKDGSKFLISMIADGELKEQVSQNFNQYWRDVYYVFGSTYYNTKVGGATYELTIKIEGELTCQVVPALDPAGVPCMFDLVHKQPFYNASTTGSFIAGMTLGQALKLKDLPAKTATLDISLPEGYDSYEEVMEAIRQAEEKGWTFNRTTYTPA